MLISRKEKEKLVIHLAHEGKTTREIAKEAHISLRDIGTIIRKETGEDKEENDDLVAKEKQKHEEQEKEKRLKYLSLYARSFQMFKDRMPLADVAIELDIKTDAVLNFYNDYLRLTRMDSLVKIYKELEKDFPIFIHLYRRIKKEGLNKQAITELLQNHNKLIHLNKQVDFYNNHISEQELKIQQLAQTINRLQQQE